MMSNIVFPQLSGYAPLKVTVSDPPQVSGSHVKTTA